MRARRPSASTLDFCAGRGTDSLEEVAKRAEREQDSIQFEQQLALLRPPTRFVSSPLADTRIEPSAGLTSGGASNVSQSMPHLLAFFGSWYCGGGSSGTWFSSECSIEWIALLATVVIAVLLVSRKGAREGKRGQRRDASETSGRRERGATRRAQLEKACWTGPCAVPMMMTRNSLPGSNVKRTGKLLPCRRRWARERVW